VWALLEAEVYFARSVGCMRTGVWLYVAEVHVLQVPEGLGAMAALRLSRLLYVACGSNVVLSGG
jgi:hypothetical protein